MNARENVGAAIHVPSGVGGFPNEGIARGAGNRAVRLINRSRTATADGKMVVYGSVFCDRAAIHIQNARAAVSSDGNPGVGDQAASAAQVVSSQRGVITCFRTKKLALAIDRSAALIQ